MSLLEYLFIVLLVVIVAVNLSLFFETVSTSRRRRRQHDEPGDEPSPGRSASNADEARYPSLPLVLPGYPPRDPSRPTDVEKVDRRPESGGSS